MDACTHCGKPYIKTRGNQRVCPHCRVNRKNARRSPVDRRLNTQDRRRATAQVRATQPNCHLCGIAIDLTLDRQRHPLSSCVDEILPRHHGGSPLDPANLGHAHRVCNTSRGTQPITPEVRQRCRELALHHMNRMTATINPW